MLAGFSIEQPCIQNGSDGAGARRAYRRDDDRFKSLPFVLYYRSPPDKAGKVLKQELGG
jgi:hypothetical protein